MIFIVAALGALGRSLASQQLGTCLMARQPQACTFQKGQNNKAHVTHN